MKKIKHFLLLFSFTTLGINSDAQWVKQSALPTERAMYSAYFLTPSHGFVVGDNHYLMETTDAGATWSLVMHDSLGTNPFYQVTFGDASTGFITGNNPNPQDMYRTTDGGQTWTPMTNFTYAGSWYHVDFVSPSHAFFGTNGACIYTPDAGTTFMVRSGFPNCPNIYGMDFRNEKLGLVAGELSSINGIYRTIDSGVTWQLEYSAIVNDVLWRTDSVALATGGTFIYRSTDGGDSWNIFATGITTGLLELEAVDSMTVTGVSGKGDVWRSNDGGQTWIQVFDGPGDLPTRWSLHFSDNLHGWLVGQSGFIYKSIDGGLTWTQVCNGVGVQLTDMAFLNNNFGLAVGENGYVFRTTNGGNWWDVQKLEVTGQIFGRTESLHGISIVDSSFAVAAGPGGTVFKTSDGGTTWQSIGYPNLPDPFWIEDVEFVNHDTGWVVGLDQDLGHDKTVYKTTNGGLTWTLAMNQGGYMWAVDFTDPLHGWIITAGGAYFLTTNGGASWQPGFLPPYFTTPTISDIEFANQNVGWVVGWDELVARTTDGGMTWTYQNIGTTTDHLFSIEAISATEAWASGRNANGPMDGVVYHTTDGGTTWTNETVGPNPYWGYSIAATPSYVWIAGTQGRIYRKDIITGVEQKDNILSTHNLLTYPNPLHQNTTIQYNVSHNGFVSLKIYDVLGNEVALLVNEIKNTGSYKIVWNAGNVVPGIYYCRFTEGNIFETSKLIVQ